MTTMFITIAHDPSDACGLLYQLACHVERSNGAMSVSPSSKGGHVAWTRGDHELELRPVRVEALFAERHEDIARECWEIFDARSRQ